MVVWGVSYQGVVLNSMTYRQQVTPEPLLGRVNTAGRMLSFGVGWTCGALGASALAGLIGLRPALVAVVSVGLVAARVRVAVAAAHHRPGRGDGGAASDGHRPPRADGTVTALLGALGRVLGVTLVLRVSDDLSPGRARWLKATVVLVVGLTPVAAVLAGVLGYGDAWLWLAVEVVTIYVWTTVRSCGRRRAGRAGPLRAALLHPSLRRLRRRALRSRGVHRAPVVASAQPVADRRGARWARLRRGRVGSPVPSSVTGWASARTASCRRTPGWCRLRGAVRAAARDRHPVRLHGRAAAPDPRRRETVVAVAVLLAKLALELGLVVGAGSRAAVAPADTDAHPPWTRGLTRDAVAGGSQRAPAAGRPPSPPPARPGRPAGAWRQGAARPATPW